MSNISKYTTFKDFYSNEYCGTCRWWDDRELRGTKCPCKKSPYQKFEYDEYGPHKSPSCKKYYEKRKDTKELEKFFNVLYKVYNPSVCYITTAIVTILEMPDNCEEIMALRSLRDNYFQINPKYYIMLAEYDIIGPQISQKLSMLDNREIVAQTAFIKFIQPVSKLIKEGNYEEATKLYSQMVLYYKETLNIVDSVDEEKLNEYNEITYVANFDTRGHGDYQRVRKQQE